MTQKKRKVTDIANIIEHMLSADILNGSRPSLADIQKFGNVLQALYPDATV